MSATQDFERRIADYYEADAPPRAPDWLLTRAFDVIDTTPQRRTRLGRPWRIPPMHAVSKMALAAVAIIAVGTASLALLRPPTAGPAEDLGIFEPVAGRIVSSVWEVDPVAIDPSGRSQSTRLRLGPEPVEALGWSSDGTDLLLKREDPPDQDVLCCPDRLSIRHADGTETLLTEDAIYMSGATIAPDGSRVVFAAGDYRGPSSLYVIDADGGQPVRIADEGSSPTFSPDGTRIAFLARSQVWIAAADGSDAHAIFAGERVLGGAVDLAWSPAGDRLAIGNNLEGAPAIFMLDLDGSGFTSVIDGGTRPFWSPDGSQIAYTLPDGEPFGGGSPGLAIANADGSDVREFGVAASGPWHPGKLDDPADASMSPSPSKTPASASPASSPALATPGPRWEAEQIIDVGMLSAFAGSRSGALLTMWDACSSERDTDCGVAWRLDPDGRPVVTGIVSQGDAHPVVAATGDGFFMGPARGGFRGVRIAEDGTTAPLSTTCGVPSWSTPTEPGRFAWAAGLLVDTVAGSMCPTSTLGPALTEGAFTAEGMLWALVDNERDPGTLMIGQYDGEQWVYHDLEPRGGAGTSLVAAAGSTVVVLHRAPGDEPGRFLGRSVSTDAGATWTETADLDALDRHLPFATSSSPDSMAFAGSSILYIADARGDLWRSTDFITFDQVAVPGGVRDLRSAGDAVLARIDVDGTCDTPAQCQLDSLVRVLADGTVESVEVR